MRGIATYVGPNGGKTTQVVLDWRNPPKTLVTRTGEVRTLVLCIHDEAPDALVRAAMQDEALVARMTKDNQQRRVREWNARRAS